MATWTITKTQGTQAVVLTLGAGAAEQVRGLIAVDADTNVSTTTVIRAWLQRTTGGATPTLQSPEKENTRSRDFSATGGSTATTWGTSPTLSGSVLLFFGTHRRGETRYVWRPPRPWAVPLLINSDQFDIRNNAGQDSTAVFGDPLSLPVLNLRRRPKKFGLWHYYNENKGLINAVTSGSTPTRTLTYQWVAYAATVGINRGRNAWNVLFGTGGGPNQFLQTNAGVVSFGGALVKKTNTSKAGVLSFAGGLIKNTITSKSGAVSFVGSILKQAGKGDSGAVEFSGAISKKTGKGTAGTENFTGSLNDQTAHALIGTLTFVGTVTKSTLKRLAGVLTFNGALQAVKVFLKTISGVLSFNGTLTKQTNKIVSGGLSFVGTITRLTSSIKAGVITFSGLENRQTGKGDSGTLTTGGTVNKRTNKIVAGVISFNGAVSRLVSKFVTGSLSFGGSLLKKTNKILAGVLSFVGSLIATTPSGHAFFQTVDGALSFGGTLIKQTRHGLSGTLSFAGDMTRQTNKRVAGVVSFVGSLTGVRVFLKVVSGALTFSGNVVRLTNKKLAGQLNTAGVLGKFISKTFSGVLGFIGTLVELFKPSTFTSVIGVTSSANIAQTTDALNVLFAAANDANPSSTAPTDPLNIVLTEGHRSDLSSSAGTSKVDMP